MTSYIALSSWWLRDDASSLAVASDSQVTADEFRQRVSQWVETLSDFAGDRWAVYHQDAAEFLAILCALWQVNKTACVASDTLAATMTRLKQSVDGFIGQFPASDCVHAPSVKNSSNTIHWQTVASEHNAVEVYTSGSSGEPKAIVKTMLALESEIEALDELQLVSPASVVLSTVTHQHLYGLVFRLLRPFCYQQAFTQFLHEYPEELIAMGQVYESFSLVSSPAHLSRMNLQQDWHLLQSRCREVYSSAAPLARADSLNVATCLAADVKEIYGSSETGAIAWRCQQRSDHDALWQPLSHINLSHAANTLLNVQFNATGEKISLADKTAFDEKGQFSLLGRTDQIVKVEGKRLSLTEMEQTLQKLEWVKLTKALLLKRKRHEVAVVAVLSDAGREALNVHGRKQLIQELQQTLKLHFEPVLLPKRWRFIDELPVNTQGKLPQKRLLDLFEDTEHKLPEVIATRFEDNNIILQCRIPAKLIYLDGHFESNAILPGVVQVHWAAHYGKELVPDTSVFHRIEALKFQQLLLPEQLFVLTLRFDTDKQKLVFSYDSEQGTHSSGRLCYAQSA